MDYVVIGAGPAGLQLGYFSQQAGRDYVVLEAGPTPGTFYRRFPRHRRMISINKPHTGWDDPEKDLRVDWNSLLSDDPALRFTRYTERYFPDAGDYVPYLIDFGKDLHIRYDCRVSRISRGFEVACDNGRSFKAKRVIVATGFGAMNLPAIPGIETAETYWDVSIDPDDFADQRVFIIGKGNSAFETADNLTERAAVIHVAGPSSIKFAWRTHFIGHLRAVNNNFLDTYQLKSQNMVLDGDILNIERRAGEYVVTYAYARRDKVVQLVYDRVIACTVAVERGVDGLIVSNHGGRQLDTAPATLDRLPIIADAVDGRVPLLIDGGIRRGTDVAKAMALGAQAVAIGRPVLWGLAASGQDGVGLVLELLRKELANALTLLGVEKATELSRDQVVP